MSFFKNIFGGRKIEPFIENSSSGQGSRKVNFGVNSDKLEAKVINFPGMDNKEVSEKVAMEKLRAEKDEFEQLGHDVFQQEPITDIDERYEKIDCKATFKELEFSKDDIIPGEVLVMYEKKKLELKIRSNTYIQGEFILTNFKFVFKPNDKDFLNEREDYFKLPLGMIDRIETKKKKNEALPKLVVTAKDQRIFKFRFASDESMKRINDEICRFSFGTLKRHFFAFKYYQANRQLEDKFQGWQTYNAEKEFQRMGLQLMPHTETLVNDITRDYKILDNRDWKISSTYPKMLVVPSRLSFDYILRCAKFRSRERLPVLTYAIEYEPKKTAVLFRCSQPKVGVSKNRCTEDEMMLRLIGDPKTEIREQFKGKPNCKVFDARGYTAALGNLVAGKGYEIVQFYKNCQVQWLDIPNIHTVRDSYVKLKAAALGDDAKFGAALADSGWYELIFGILSGSRAVASALLKGINSVVHCSDGWDRTSQLCALAQIILDPYFRTMEGFQVLIEKDFVAFGHQFCLRMSQGMNNPNNEQKSQIFIQFLDCMTQLLYQFPLSFEFNIRYLSQIARRCMLNIYGTFLCDSQQQIYKASVNTRTVSIWSYTRQNRQMFLNPYYQPEWSKYLDVNPTQKNMRLWKQHFLYYTEGFKDVYSIYSCDFSDENPQIIHSQKKKENQLLRDKHAENERQIRKLQEQIEQVKKRQQQRKNKGQSQ